MKAKVWMIALAIVGLGFTSCDKEDELDDMAPAAAAPAGNNGEVPGTVDDAPRPTGDANTASR